jgi:hypothetical protein
MAAEFDIQKLYDYIFGYRGLPFPAFGLQGALKVLPNVAGLINQAKNGATLIMPMGFKDLKTSELFYLQNEPLFSMTCQKTILKTAMAGNTTQGTVKELINTEDWLISVKGLLFNEDYPDNYPSDAVEELSAFFQKNKAFRILCPLADMNNIVNVVVENISWAEMKGIENAQGYTLSLISDAPFELIIN